MTRFPNVFPNDLVPCAVLIMGRLVTEGLLHRGNTNLFFYCAVVAARLASSMQNDVQFNQASYVLVAQSLGLTKATGKMLNDLERVILDQLDWRLCYSLSMNKFPECLLDMNIPVTLLLRAYKYGLAAGVTDGTECNDARVVQIVRDLNYVFGKNDLAVLDAAADIIFQREID